MDPATVEKHRAATLVKVQEALSLGVGQVMSRELQQATVEALAWSLATTFAAAHDVPYEAAESIIVAVLNAMYDWLDASRESN